MLFFKVFFTHKYYFKILFLALRHQNDLKILKKYFEVIFFQKHGSFALLNTPLDILCECGSSCFLSVFLENISK